MNGLTLVRHLVRHTSKSSGTELWQPQTFQIQAGTRDLAVRHLVRHEPWLALLSVLVRVLSFGVRQILDSLAVVIDKECQNFNIRTNVKWQSIYYVLCR